MSDVSAADMERVLACLKENGLIGRITALKVGGVELQMLPAIPGAAATPERDAREAKQFNEDLLFASS